jgi:hypothetical protein
MGTEFALSLEKVFEGRLFNVPDYQRGYAWTRGNLDDLLEDLELLEDAHDHYTGTLVLHKRGGTELDEFGRSYTSVDVVDGQQRLTSLVLLLSVLRRELLALDSQAPLAAGIEAGYLRMRRGNGEVVTRLTLGADTNHYWASVALADEAAPLPPDIRSQKRLGEARDHFMNYLSAQRRSRPTEYKAFLLSLFDKVTHRLKLIPYEVDDAADVGVIFEVMNDRGRPLSELEKAKNYLLYLAVKLSQHGELTTKVNQAWSNLLRRLMQANLGSSADEDQLLRAHWLMSAEPAPRDWGGTASIKERLSLRTYRDRKPQLLGEAREYVTSLESASIAYCDIQSPSRGDAFATAQATPKDVRRLREASERLLRLRVVATFLPVLMAARVTQPAEVDGYLRLVEECELYAFRVYRILESRSDRGYSQMCRFGYDLFRGAASIEDTVTKVRATTLAYCPNATFDERLNDDRNWYWWSGIRYFLYEYEYELAGNTAVQLSWDVLAKRDLERSVEHILPQTATRHYWTQRFDKAQRDRWTHDIGNLCLTQDNSTYYNHAFPEKRGHPGAVDGQGHFVRCYANSSLRQERELATVVDWTPVEVASRRAKLLSWAKRRWGIAGGDVSHAALIPPEEEDEVLSTAAAESA